MEAVPRPALPPGRVAEASLLSAVAVLVAWAVFDGGGSRDDALATVGIAALVTATIGLTASARGRLPVPRLDRAGIAVALGLVALVGWTGLSIVWSIAGDRSWEWLDRGLVDLAFLALGLLAAALTEGARRLAVGIATALGAAVGWSLLGVAIPSLFEDGDRIARLREPVGYWNGLALLADGALVFGLWAARSDARAVRLAGAMLTYGATISLLLTQSRAGVVGGVAAVGLWLAASSNRAADALRAVVFVCPGLAVAGWAFTRPALVEDGVLRADRVDDGRVFAVLTVAGGVLVVVGALRIDAVGLVDRHASRVRATLALAVTTVVLLAAGGVVAAVGNPFSWTSSQLSGGECVNAPGRLTELCANNRLDWWREAVDIAADRPVGGSGAGTFAIARRRYRDDATPVSQPHSVPFQLLADTGVVGFALGALVAFAAAVAVVQGVRLVSGRERDAALALACLVLAFSVHVLVDYDLDFLAVTAPVALALGALLAVGRPTASVRARLPGVISLVAVASAAVLAVLLPSLGEREVDRALSDVDAGRIESGIDHADRARLLDPLSLAPLDALAYAADAAGHRAAAVAWYEEATDLQPENPDAWYELGFYHATVTGNQCAAYQALNASYTLDPASTRWTPGGLLDVARAAVNEGACE